MAILDNRVPSKVGPLIKGIKTVVLVRGKFVLLIGLLLYFLYADFANQLINSSLLSMEGRAALACKKMQETINPNTGKLALYFSDKEQLLVQNAQLTKALKELQSLKAQLELIQHDKTALANIVKYTDYPGQIVATAHFISSFLEPYSNSSLIEFNTSDSSEIQPGQIVLSNSYLIGRVRDVGTNFARILLVTDGESRVPVMLLPSGQKGILAGAGTERLELFYITDPAKVSLDDVIITTGDGVRYPRGLLVARVSEISGGRVFAKMILDLRDINLVTLIKMPT